MNKFANRWAWVLMGIIAVGGAASLYYFFDPAAHTWFPKCPVKALTGLDCPGCGSQRAIHALLHGRISEAFHFNALILPFIPYVGLGLGYRLIKEPNAMQLKLRKILYGEYAIWVVGIVTFLYFILRNVM